MINIKHVRIILITHTLIVILVARWDDAFRAYPPLRRQIRRDTKLLICMYDTHES